MSEMGTGIDPRVDYVFKRLFGDEDNALLLGAEKKPSGRCSLPCLR